jgi:hypothetical protein
MFWLTPQQSKLNFETRTPTAWGEARTFIEFDFTGVQASQRPTAISDNLVPRLRYAYGTLGGLLAGQANSNFSDPDASLETIDFGGLVGGPAPSRIPQVRYTIPLAGWWNLPGALSFSAETPETEIWSPFTGVTGTDPSTAIATIPGTTASNPLKSPAPDVTMAWYIPQPWGHVDFAGVVRPTLEVKDGLFINQTFAGFGAQFSGDVKPRWFGWDKDYIVWHVAGGNAIGRNISESSANGELGLVSNYTAALAVTKDGAANIIIKPVMGWGGTVGYQHHWSPTLRSNIGFGIRQEDIPGLNGAVCPAGPPGSTAATNRNNGTGGCGLSARLINAVANLFYTPLPFVDFGLEYMYGHRITVANQKGDENVIESRFRVRF